MITGNAQEVFTKLNHKNCVTKVETAVDVKSYLFHFGQSCKRANDVTVRNTVKLIPCDLFQINLSLSWDYAKVN